jgi:EmrB/QacA subfamily drug resistance transporter
MKKILPVPDGSTSPQAALVVICLTSFLVPFMLSSVGVALPTMGREFGASAMQLGLVETMYILSVSVFLLAFGRLSDILGRRRVFLWGIGIFTLSTAAISMAWSIQSIIFMRFFQGVGGAMINVTGLAILVSLFPPTQRGRVLGWMIGAVYAGISCGPPMGGFLATWFSWRAIFWVGVPIGAACLVAGMTRLRTEWREAQGERFDWQGSLLYGLGVGLIVYGATHIGEGISGRVLVGAGLAVLVLFLRFESGRSMPVLDIALLRSNRVFAFSNLAAMINYASTFGVTFFMSLFLQYAKGMSAQEAGLILAVQPVVQFMVAPFAGRLSDRVPAAWVATAGMGVCALSLGLASTVGAQTGPATIFVLLVSLGLGFAFFAAPNTSVIMGSVEKKHIGLASALTGVMRTLGMTWSMIAVTVLFSLYMGKHAVTAETLPRFLNSMQTAFLFFCILCLVGVGLSLFRTGKVQTRKGTSEEVAEQVES